MVSLDIAFLNNVNKLAKLRRHASQVGKIVVCGFALALALALCFALYFCPVIFALALYFALLLEFI